MREIYKRPEKGYCRVVAAAFVVFLTGACYAALIDKGAGDSSRFILAKDSLGPDIAVRQEYITSENISNMVASIFNPQSHYEFEFVLGSLDIDDGSDFAATRSAFNTWVGLADSAVSMTETYYDGSIALGGTDGQNEISWIPYTGTNWWVDVLGYSPSAIAVTSTWYIPSTGEVVERDLHFNDTYMYWYTDTDGASPSNDPFYVGHVALHEIGHIYGLKDVYNPGQPAYEEWMGSGNEQLTMYGYSGPLDEDITLTDIDIAAMAMAHPIPEPATVFLFALAAVGLRRKYLSN